MIDTECPLCGHKGKVPEKFSGKQVKCPECCNVFNIGGATSGSKPGTEKIGAATANTTSGSKAGTEKISPTSGSKAGNEKLNGPAKANEKKGFRSSAETHHGTMKVVKPGGTHPGTTAQKVVKSAGSNQGNAKKAPVKAAAGKASPFDTLAYEEEPAAGRRKRRRGPSMLPLLFSLLLLVGCVIGGTYVYHAYFPSSETSSTEQASAATDTASTETKAKDKTDAETKTEERPPDEFVNVTQGPFRYGDVSIRVTSASVETVKLKGQGPKEDAKHLVIKLEIENRGVDRVDYQGWGTAEAINMNNPPVMKDSTGKLYNRMTFGPGAPVEGMLLAESIQPGKSVQDVLVFEVPTDSAPYVRLELPAANLNKAGKIRLEIPKSLYGGGLVAKKDPKKDPKMEPPMPGEESKTVVLLRQTLKKARTAKEQADLITALGEQGPSAYSALPDLIEFIKSPNEVLRVEAIAALGKIGPVAAKDGLPALNQALAKDASFKVRAEAAKTLGKFGIHAKEAIPTLMEAIKDKDVEVADNAKMAIKQITMVE